MTRDNLQRRPGLLNFLLQLATELNRCDPDHVAEVAYGRFRPDDLAGLLHNLLRQATCDAWDQQAARADASSALRCRVRTEGNIWQLLSSCSAEDLDHLIDSRRHAADLLHDEADRYERLRGLMTKTRVEELEMQRLTKALTAQS